jgi:hypothetical protein
MIYPISYLLDQFLNMVFGFGAMGLCLVLIAVLANQFGSQRRIATNLNTFPNLRNFCTALFLTIWSLIAAFSAPSCGMSFKSGFTILLLWLVFLLWSKLHFIRIVCNSKISRFVIVFSLIALCAQLLNWGLLSNFWYFNKPSGLYTEPSHLALYLLPVIGFRLLQNRQDYLAIGAVIFIAIFFNSATFTVGIILLLFFIALRKFIHSSNKSLYSACTLGAIFGGLLLIYAGFLDTSILTDRIEGIAKAIYRSSPAGITNASAIVWLNGWSQAYETLLVTRGLGLGINQMGCGDFVNIGRFSDHMALWTGGIVLNWNDGSFLISKLTAELGLIGICIVCYLIIKSCVAIYNYLVADFKANALTPSVLINAIGGVCILLLLFVRSNGYFLEPVILNLSLLFAAHYMDKK